MSSFEADPEVGVPRPATMELLEGAPVALGGPRGFPVTRTLPNRQRRMVGAWCFLDTYGPVDLDEPQATGPVGMRVGPHPHTGLQTVTWLVSGEVLHRDSLGSVQEIRPGQLNLMTAGRGISHSEETPAEHSPVLQGVQLWVALPHAVRDMAPEFAHHDDLPVFTLGGVTATVLMGTLAGHTSPARIHTPLVGAELTVSAPAVLPLNPSFEYAVITLDGVAAFDETEVKTGPLLYLGSGRSSLTVTADAPARVMLLGGEPFDERIVMWWNFIGRDHDEIVQMRADWADETPRFGTVRGYAGSRLPAPPMPLTRLVPRGRIR